MEAIAAISSRTTGPSALDSALKTAIWSLVAIDLIVHCTKRTRGQWFHFCKCFVRNGGAENGNRPMELTAEYWHERAERLRDIADFVDEQAREILLRIAGNDEARAQASKQLPADTGS